MEQYQTLMQHIQPPAALEQKVLSAVKKQQRRRSWKPALRIAACAVLVLGLALGSMTLNTHWTADTAVRDDEPSVSVSTPVTGLFTLSARAADMETVVPAAPDGTLALDRGPGESSLEVGTYTGCLFQINGEDIASVSLSLDCGKLYRFQTRTGLTQEDVRQIYQEDEKPDIRHSIGTAADVEVIGPEDPVWFSMDMTLLDSDVTETYDPDVQYGFWIPAMEHSKDEDLTLAFESEIDQLDGGHLTVTVRNTAGAEQIQVYSLSTGRLKVTDSADGTPMKVLAEWAEEGEPYSYGVMLTPAESN